MTVGANGIGPGRPWSAALICPNRRCYKLLVRLKDVVITSGAGPVMEFCCLDPSCRRRSIFGGPDPESPPRSQAILVHSTEEYHAYRDRASNLEPGERDARRATWQSKKGALNHEQERSAGGVSD